MKGDSFQYRKSLTVLKRMMPVNYKSTLRHVCKSGPGEALLIIVAAALLGFGYSAISGKGLFLSTRAQPVSLPTSPFLGYDQALALFNAQQAVFIDARIAGDFGRGHIPHAVNIPLHGFDPHHPLLSALPKDRLLVVYCDGEECSSSVELAKLLGAAGFSSVKIFFGGWNEWLSHRQPAEP